MDSVQYSLMLKDIPVLKFDVDGDTEAMRQGLAGIKENSVSAVNPHLLPYYIRSKQLTSTVLSDYLSYRVLASHRTNAGKICKAFGIEHATSTKERVSIALLNRAVSIKDSYWIKEDEEAVFDMVNIRKHGFQNIREVALWGKTRPGCYQPIHPELTTGGLYRKTWYHSGEGLYLLKSDNHEYNINTRMEVLCSNLLNCFRNKIECVTYEGRIETAEQEELYVDYCECFVNDAYSLVEARELMEFYRYDKEQFRSFLGYQKAVSSIAVLDYILANTDRHLENYGFLMDNDSGEIKCLAPLYDFNMGLVSDWFGMNPDVGTGMSQMFDDGCSIRALAYEYRNTCDLILDYKKFMHLKEEYSRRMPRLEVVFDNVFSRCKELEIDIE